MLPLCVMLCLWHEGGAELVLIGSWTNESSIHLAHLHSGSGVLTLLGASTVGGVQIEALYPVGDSILLAASNPCDFRDPVSRLCLDQHRDPRICTVSSLSVGSSPKTDGAPLLKRIDRVWSGGLGPTALALHPDGSSVAVANYQSGIASLLPFNPQDGRLSHTTASTRLINKSTSLAHDVLFDSRCGADASLLLIDAGALELGTFDGTTAQKQHETSMRFRGRHGVIDERRGLLYVLYELEGSLGVWPWHGPGASATTSCGSAGDAELYRIPTTWPHELCANFSALSEWQATCNNAVGATITRPFPTQIVLLGDRLYVTNAGSQGDVNGTVAVFALSGSLVLQLIQVFAPPRGAWSLATSTDGRFLLTSNPDTGSLSSLQLCPISGLILKVASSTGGITLASNLAVMALPTPATDNVDRTEVTTTSAAATAQLPHPTIQPGLRWQYVTGDLVDSTPALSADASTVFFGSRDCTLYAVDALDGTLRWSYATGAPIASSPRVSPDGSTVVIGSWDNKTHAVEVRTGHGRWSFETADWVEATPTFSPDGDTVYVGSHDARVYAIDAKNGRERWVFVTGDRVDSTAALSSDGSILFVGSNDGNLYALATTSGRELWRASAQGPIDFSSPALAPDGRTVFVGSNGGSLNAYDTKTGDLRWTLATGGAIESSPVVSVDGASVFVGTYNQSVIAVDATSGTLRWAFTMGSRFVSSPRLSPDGLTIYIGGNDGSVYALNATMGSPLWRMPLASAVESTPAISPDGSYIFIGAQCETQFCAGAPAEDRSMNAIFTASVNLAKE